MLYQRSALVFDAEGGPLSGLSLSLISLGLSPHYSADLDELVLLSREYRSQVGAILVPADVVEERLRGLIERIVEPLGLSAAAVVPVGASPDPEKLDSLAECGLRWALWRPFEAPDLRFVVAQVLSNSDPEELRVHARIPCSIPAQVESPLRQAAVVLTDLSQGGCFARLAEPFASGTRIRLHFALDELRVTLVTRVTWTTGPGTPEWHENGMGIEFLEMDDGARAQLARHVDERVWRYRVSTDRKRRANA